VQQRLPPSVLVALATLAGSTFIIGLALEEAALGFLQRHPYIVNLLSGATGFSTSALVIAVVLNRAVTAYHADQWRSEAWSAMQGLQYEVDAMEALVDTPVDEVGNKPPHRHLGLHASTLGELVHQRGGLGLLLSEETLLPQNLPFKDPSGEARFLEHVRAIVENWLDLLLQALDVTAEPDVAAAAHKLKVSARQSVQSRKGAQSYQAAEALCQLVLAIQHHPNYRASQDFSLSSWERMTLRLDDWRDRVLRRRYRRPFRW
jgi:hypothetical protein